MKLVSAKKKKLISLIIVLAVALLFLSINGSPVTLRVDVPGGYYTENITVTVNKWCLGDIYYTLDGTEPTRNSEKYTGKIELTNAKKLPNRASARTDGSIGYDGKILEENGFTDPEYVAPNYNVDKAYCLRIAGFDLFGNKYDEVSYTYFVNLDDNSIYDDIAIVSITMDDADLWDYEDGIYTTGKDWDDFLQMENSSNESLAEIPWTFWNANYRRYGIESEKKCNLQVYDKGKKLILDQNCGIRIQGSGSRAEAQKSFSLWARKDYDRAEYFREDLTGSGYLQDKYILSSGGQDQIGKISDYIVQMASADMPFATMDMRPCVMFLNGEFWGFYFIEEPYNLTYFSNHYKVNQQDVILFKNNAIEEGYVGEESEYEEMFTFITENDMTDPEKYAKACEYIDIENYASYGATMLYLGRIGDWPIGNEACWKTRIVDEDNPYADGKWRWTIFDFNSRDEDGYFVMDNNRVDQVDAGLANYLWNSLFQNDDFKARTAYYLQRLALEDYNADKMISLIDDYEKQYNEALFASARRFYGEGRDEQVILESEEKKYFFKRRKDICKSLVWYMCGWDYLIDEWKE